MFRPIARRASIFFRRVFSTSAANPRTACESEPNYLLEELCTRGHLQEAFSLFYTLSVPQSQSQSRQTYATLFHACARLNCLQQGQALHRHMLANNSSPDLYLTNHLINMYSKCGHLEYAHQLFDEMTHRNIVSWTALISGYAQHSRADKCFRLFSDMLAHYRPTEFAYASVLTLCDYDRGRQVLRFVDWAPEL